MRKPARWWSLETFWAGRLRRHFLLCAEFYVIYTEIFPGFHDSPISPTILI